MTEAQMNTEPRFNMREANFNMIEQQIRTWEVLDPAVLALFDKVPRANFVLPEQIGLAFADVELPIGHGQTMLPPKVEGRILQAVQVKPTDKVLLIGTGSGYLTALLASLAHQVVAVEYFADLSALAQKRLHQQNIHNVTFIVGDAVNGWADYAPYDVIIYTGSLEVRPQVVEQMLNLGGRLFAVIGEMPIMQATLTERVAAEAFKHEVLFETTLPPMVNAPKTEKFSF
jgi:protein-L-isoaspartate(D-aspartate) O-methyltransferase